MNGFHVSLAWSLTEPSADVKSKVHAALEAEGANGVIRVKDNTLKMEVGNIKVKIGNAVHVVELGAGKSAGGENAELQHNRKRKTSIGS